MLSRIMILLMSMLYAHIGVSDVSLCQHQRCMAVVDMGSTGSRVHLYAYDMNAQQEPIHIKEIWTNHRKPGFATLNLDDSSTMTYLDDLFATAPSLNIPTYFYATGGMRLLPVSQQNRYFGVIKDWANGGHENIQLREARTLTGQEEGYYAWMSVNYYNGVFDDSSKPLVSVLDTGGASVQIAFPLSSTDNIPSDNVVDFNRYGRKASLYVQSFLGVGLEETMHQFLDEPTCFSEQYNLPNHAHGTGDLSHCRAKVKTLINQIHHVDSTIQPILNASAATDWYVLGGLQYFAQVPPMQFTDHQVMLKDLTEQGEAVCKQNWFDLEKTYAQNSYIYRACFVSSYYTALLKDGYGLTTQPIHYFPETLSLDWTIGFLLSDGQASVTPAPQ